MFIVWWFPSGFYNNTSVTDSTNQRATLAWLLICTYMLEVSTFSALVIAGLSSAETASNLANVLGFIMLLFCGILAAPSFLPGFWKFVYRANPFTYLTEGLMAAGLSRAPVECEAEEYLRLDPPRNQTCGQYLMPYMAEAGGYLAGPDARASCEFCPIAQTDHFLAAVGVRYENRWRDFGLMWAFIVFNVAGAVFLYWALRVPKRKRAAKLPAKTE
jgi:ATP-binding cassette, subfamily G (WHITE), member 2, PDR